MTLFELIDPKAKALAAIRKIAGELKVTTGDLMLRYSRRLARVQGNGPRAVSQFEIDMNLPRGRLKGFDALYTQATSDDPT